MTAHASIINDHPLVWLTVDTATLKNHRNAYEYCVLVRLADMLASDIEVCIVADRGFGDQKLYRVLTEELHTSSAGASSAASATPRIRASAWAWGRSVSVRRSGVTGYGC